MHSSRLQEITDEYSRLRIALVGDFCLDRYMEIDPAKQETSIETGLPVHNVVNVRSQPGAAGTILNNLVALGIGEVYPVGFCGEDGEGYELQRALFAKPGVQAGHFLQTSQRRTFTYCKPLVIDPGKPPVELHRLDSKNWTPTPDSVQGQVIDSLRSLATTVDAIILMDQVDVPETGVVTTQLLHEIGRIIKSRSELLVIADSRRGLKGYPPVCFKMNSAELRALTGADSELPLNELKRTASSLAQNHGRNVFVTLAELGILGAAPGGEIDYVPAFPVQSQIDVVGAGDSVTANLTAALAAGATQQEALEMAMAAASIVIHQLGTTGTASVRQIQALIRRGMSE